MCIQVTVWKAPRPVEASKRECQIFVLSTNPSTALPLDNSIIKTKLGAIKCRLRCNSESGALVKLHHGAI